MTLLINIHSKFLKIGLKSWNQKDLPTSVNLPSKLVLAVVGNKIDRTDDEQVPYNEAKEYSQSIGAIFKLTSAKEGKGVN